MQIEIKLYKYNLYVVRNNTRNCMNYQPGGVENPQINLMGLKK